MSTSSSLPPLPPGVPLRPGSDSYRPLPPPPSAQFPRKRSPEQFDMYTFHGNGYSSRDVTHQPNSRRPRSPPRPPLPVESFGRQHHGGDSYRPATNGFSFNMEPPSSIDLGRVSDSYRPSTPTSREQRNDSNNNGRSRTQDRGYRPNRGRGGTRGHGTWSSKAADRPFLLSTRASTPELMPGMEEVDGAGVKYRALEDLSDSDEADMDVSSDDEDERKDMGSEGQPKMKQARLGLSQSADGDSVPKWSNPDPYTVLPPPDESQRKKMDVVKLIRKARVVSSSESATRIEAVSDDFISFDFNDEGKEDLYRSQSSTDDEAGAGVPGAPRGPRGHRDHENGRDFRNLDLMRSKLSGRKLDASFHPLGNRKRKFEDEIKDAPLLPLKRAPTKLADGSVVGEWRAVTGVSATPWCTVDHAATENMGFWLHKEIMDFYYHVKPTEFEDSVRFDLVSRLRASVRNNWSDADIHPFGSFVAGLYLPTADMDLVFASENYMAGRSAKYHERKSLWRFHDFLISEGIPVTGSIEVISKAKVPIVKYVDRMTGLRVDVSFENDTGIIANKTFKDWKAQYPAMPILVTVLKQFLAMRGLNEPVNGGIGGFSVTCLVISLLQLLPQVQSGNMIPEHHLGEILMEFLDLYGNEFNAATTAIQFDPPGYVPKTRLPKFFNNKVVDKEKLSIVDPNNDANDIAGGSKNTPKILETFSRAFRDLQSRMSELHSMPINQRHDQSILGVILGGNYFSFDIQREHLRKCYQSLVKS